MIKIILLLMLLFFVLKNSCLNKENFDFIPNGSPSWYLPKKYNPDDWEPSVVGISGK